MSFLNLDTQNVSSTTMQQALNMSSTTIAPMDINNNTTILTTMAANSNWTATSTQSYWNMSNWTPQTTPVYWNVSIYGNYSSNWTSGAWQPYYPGGVVEETPMYTYPYFSYAYLYAVFLLLLLFVGLVFAKLAMNKRKQVQAQLALQQMRARQNAQSAYMNTNSTLNIHEETSCNNSIKSPDCPPAYDDVIQPSGATTSATGANNSGIATITIENASACNATTSPAAAASGTTETVVPSPTVIDIVTNEKTNQNTNSV
ncbi:uncharacterized protein isoform X1 [Musca autumnalis]|uniref:uncharacterized protein isoform X1 n=1 Tax=Musca autumnalis TaxID=221902 RepID=UPI003CEEFE23